MALACDPQSGAARMAARSGLPRLGKDKAA
jgi:hypothetical protein